MDLYLDLVKIFGIRFESHGHVSELI
jgi:hypothetical protein